MQMKWLLILLPVLIVTAGCKHLTTSRGAEVNKPQPLQISANGVDAAEPSTASAADGTFYVAWVNHDAKQADVMLARFNNNGEQQGAAARVNREPGIATAWRGD